MIDLEKDKKLKINLVFKYLPWVYLADISLRILCVYFYLQNTISALLFVILQVILLVIVGIRYSRYESKIFKKYQKVLNPAYSSKFIEFSIDDNVPSSLVGVQAIGGFCFAFWFAYHSISNHSWFMYLVFIFIASLGSMIFILAIIFTIQLKVSKGLISVQVNSVTQKKNKENIEEVIYTDVTKQYPNILSLQSIEEEVINLDSVDYNDTQIAKLESELKNINYKMDAYLMESVFLGGLAFSGFLTVAAANFLGKETEVFQTFIGHCLNFVTICGEEDIKLWFIEIQKNFFRNDLYILIMLLCLMASVFFLLVLTLRLRLTSLSLNMDHLIRIMTVFNAKEEELYNMQYERAMEERHSNRLKNVSKKIDIALSDANKLLSELKPTVTMMSIYRNIALFLFYSVLIVSGFYFMPIIASTIFVLAVFTQIFRLLETYSKLDKIRNLLKKH